MQFYAYAHIQKREPALIHCVLYMCSQRLAVSLASCTRKRDPESFCCLCLEGSDRHPVYLYEHTLPCVHIHTLTLVCTHTHFCAHTLTLVCTYTCCVHMHLLVCTCTLKRTSQSHHYLLVVYLAHPCTISLWLYLQKKVDPIHCLRSELWEIT